MCPNKECGKYLVQLEFNVRKLVSPKDEAH